MSWELGLGGGVELGGATGNKERGHKSEYAVHKGEGLKGQNPFKFKS